MPIQITSQDINRLRSGDEAAFALIYDTFSAQVYYLAFRFLKDKELSEEIVQEVFLRLWNNRGQLDEKGNIWLYLYVICKRLSLNSLRRIHQSSILFDRLLHRIEELHNETEESIIAADLARLTDELIRKLPKQQQLIFNLSRIDGLSHKEIAVQLNISQNTVKNHIVEALKNIKSKFNFSDFTYFLGSLFMHFFFW